jgi:hypothetical protein
MKIFPIVLVVILLALIGGFIYLANLDVHVEQNQVEYTVEQDRFYNESSP